MHPPLVLPASSPSHPRFPHALFHTHIPLTTEKLQNREEKEPDNKEAIQTLQGEQDTREQDGLSFERSQKEISQHLGVRNETKLISTESEHQSLINTTQRAAKNQMSSASSYRRLSSL